MKKVIANEINKLLTWNLVNNVTVVIPKAVLNKIYERFLISNGGHLKNHESVNLVKILFCFSWPTIWGTFIHIYFHFLLWLKVHSSNKVRWVTLCYPWASFIITTLLVMVTFCLYWFTIWIPYGVVSLFELNWKRSYKLRYLVKPHNITLLITYTTC